MILTDTEDMLEFLDGMEVKTFNPIPKAGEYEIEIFKPEGSVTVLEIIISNIPPLNGPGKICPDIDPRGDDITYIRKEFTWLEYNEKNKECILYDGNQRKLWLVLRNGQELLRDFKIKRLFNE